ncbi:hypothetical protein RB195_002603 [Necator americanus]|uniref:Uncharacterized protein n=1 Tax=Necator americanus TaxID=51031 RepID=A0ABR1DJU7_NECAM
MLFVSLAEAETTSGRWQMIRTKEGIAKNNGNQGVQDAQVDFWKDALTNGSDEESYWSAEHLRVDEESCGYESHEGPSSFWILTSSYVEPLES